MRPAGLPCWLQTDEGATADAAVDEAALLVARCLRSMRPALHADNPMTFVGLRCQWTALHVYILPLHHMQCFGQPSILILTASDGIEDMTHSIARQSSCRRSQYGPSHVLIDELMEVFCGSAFQAARGRAGAPE